MNLKRIGLDTSKAVFTLHGVDHDEKIVLRRNTRRAELEAFFAKLPPTLVALEVCGGSHHWGRQLAALGHTVRLIPPQYVKPFVRRGKNDRNDAEAISEAAARPDMPSVPVKAAEQQANAIVLSARELLVRQRTQLVNAVRGHAAEFGIVAARSISHRSLRRVEGRTHDRRRTAHQFQQQTPCTRGAVHTCVQYRYRALLRGWAFCPKLDTPWRNRDCAKPSARRPCRANSRAEHPRERVME